MLKNILAASFVFFGLVVCPAWALEGSLGFQAGAADSFRFDGATIPSFGFNGYAFLDFKLDPAWSLGVGSGLSDMIDGTNRLYVDGTELYVKLTPWAGPWKPYFTAGAGVRLAYEIDHNSAHRWWPGDFQTSAAVGILHPLDEGIDLNVSAFDDLSPGTVSTLNTVGLRAGLSFDFGHGPSPVPAPEPRPQASAPVPETVVAAAPPETQSRVSAPAPEAEAETKPAEEKSPRHSQGYHWTQPKRKRYEAVRFRWKKSSTLEAVAAAAYGEACDFPIIVDANKKKLGGPAGLKKGTMILLPQDVTSRDLERACEKSGTEEYKAWNSVR